MSQEKPYVAQDGNVSQFLPDIGETPYKLAVKALRQLEEQRREVVLRGPDRSVIATGLLEWSSDLQRYGVAKDGSHVTFAVSEVGGVVEATITLESYWSVYPVSGD